MENGRDGDGRVEVEKWRMGDFSRVEVEKWRKGGNGDGETVGRC